MKFEQENENGRCDCNFKLKEIKICVGNANNNQQGSLEGTSLSLSLEGIFLFLLGMGKRWDLGRIYRLFIQWGSFLVDFFPFLNSRFTCSLEGFFFNSRLICSLDGFIHFVIENQEEPHGLWNLIIGGHLEDVILSFKERDLSLGGRS